MFQSTLFIYEERNSTDVMAIALDENGFNPLSSFTKREIADFSAGKFRLESPHSHGLK